MYKKIIYVVILLIMAVLQLKAQTTGPSYLGVRPITEINNPNLSEGYPYLSSDGLRLYYLQGSGGPSTSALYVANRTAMGAYSTFGSPVAVGGIPSGITSYWNSSGELEIFYILNQKVYTASRTTNGSAIPFGTGSQITLDTTGLTNFSSGYIAAPSVSPATSPATQRYMYLYYVSSTGTRSILQFYQSAPNSTTYKYTCTVPIPSGYTVGSGQLSSNGSRYYLSLLYNCTQGSCSPTCQSSNVYYVNTSLLNACSSLTIANFNALQGEISNAALQPSVSVPGTTSQDMVFVVNPSILTSVNTIYCGGFTSLWNENELYITSFTPTSGFSDSRVSDPLSLNDSSFKQQLYLSDPVPNPSSGEVIINYIIPESYGSASIVIYSIEGLPVKTIPLDTQQSSVFLPNTDLNGGLYLYSLHSSQGTITKKMLIIK